MNVIDFKNECVYEYINKIKVLRIKKTKLHQELLLVHSLS